MKSRGDMLGILAAASLVGVASRILDGDGIKYTPVPSPTPRFQRRGSYRPPLREPFRNCKRCKGRGFVSKKLNARDEYPLLFDGEDHYVACFKCEGHGKHDSSDPPRGVPHGEHLGAKHPGEKPAWREDEERNTRND